MGSQGGGSASIGGIQDRNRDLKSNPLTREGSFYSLTLDEMQNHLGVLGKPLSSMNLDEFLETVWTAEANNQATGGADCAPQPDEPSPILALDRQSSLKLSRDISKKTVDELWQDIQQGQKNSSLDRKATLGELTLEDFLVKAGVVAKSSSGEKESASVLGGIDSTEFQQQVQWGSYQIPSIPSQQQQQSNLSVFMVGKQPIPFVGNTTMDCAYPETQMTMSSSPVMGTYLDPQTPRRKRVCPDDIVEKSVERRQKRMIKNRESAARSRARKQACTHELEHKIACLEEENERLKKQKEWEKALPSVQPPQPTCQLRRTSSGPI